MAWPSAPFKRVNEIETKDDNLINKRRNSGTTVEASWLFSDSARWQQRCDPTGQPRKNITINLNENDRIERNLDYFRERRLKANLKRVQAGYKVGIRREAVIITGGGKQMTQTYNMTNYSQTHAGFRHEVPEDFNFARDVLDQWAQDRNLEALWWLGPDGQERRVSYWQLSQRSLKLANVLCDLGVRKGDTVVAILGRKIEWWEVFAACLRIGALVSPGTAQLSTHDIAYRVDAAAATCIVTDQANADKADRLDDQNITKLLVGGRRGGWHDYDALVPRAADSFEIADSRADDEAVLYFTSGTTGRPKMTVHTQASYGIGHKTTGEYWLDQKAGDVHWNISDTGWAKAAWSSFYGPLICGSCVFIDDASEFNPVRTLDILSRYPITTMCGAPTVYRMLVQQNLSGVNFPALRHCVAAGEPLNPEVIEIWRAATGIFIRDGYGQTESVLLCGNYLCMDVKPGSMGRPSPGIDLQIIDDECAVVADNTEGDIAVRVKPVRPVGLFKEYRDAPEATSGCFRGDWYITGDRAHRDEEGYLWFVGRADDVIISSGYRIGPFEVESALLEHPAVVESAVVASPDETRGEIVKALVVLAGDYEPGDELRAELQNHVKSVTAPYKYPRKIDFVDSLPKTVSGKTKRKELRNSEFAQVS